MHKFYTALGVLIISSLLSFSAHGQELNTSASSSPLRIESATYPRPEAWYSSKEALFSWTLPPDVTAVRTLYDTQPQTFPTKEYEPPISSKRFTVEEDGVYYFHIQFKTEAGWSKALHRKFQIDSNPPENLSVSLVDGTSTVAVRPRLLIVANDSGSGLDRVALSVSGMSVERVPAPSNIYMLPVLDPGTHTANIAVIDKAGNSTETTVSFTIEKLTPPTISEYTRHSKEGEIVVSGATYPNTTVEVLLIGERNRVEIDTVESNSDGTFRMMWTRDVAPGVYDMRARVVRNDGAASDYTEPRVMFIESGMVVRLGKMVVNWLSLILILILVMVLIAATFWYSLVQFSRFRRKVHQTMKEAEHTLKANVAALRRDTEEFHTILVKAEKKRELTKEEQQILKKFKKRLDTTEKEIEKKLEQIG